MIRADMPKCPFCARDCFAFDFSTKSCIALEDTKFHPLRGCRFYKTKKQYDEENKEHKGDKKK